MQFTQNEIEAELFDPMPRCLRRKVAVKTGIYESVIYGYFNADDPRKSPHFETLRIQAALEEADPAEAERVWQTMNSLREASMPRLRSVNSIDKETAQGIKEDADVVAANLNQLPLRDQLREVRQAIAQKKRQEMALLEMIKNENAVPDSVAKLKAHAVNSVNGRKG